METLTPASTVRHTTIRVSTRGSTEFIDLTERLDALVAECNLRIGFVNVQSLHTTASIVVNEHEPLLLADFTTLLERVVPRGSGYRHDDPTARTVNLAADERVNGHAHCQALLLGASVCLNVIDGRLRLGRWQRVFLVELDGPREREISIVILGEAGR